MKTVGIIAEYNPFHKGHQYQIAQLKEKTGADYVMIAMSGDFLQRGVPSIMNKYARAKMALAAGADPVYAAIIGNIAAGIVVKQYGCATTTIDEILQAVPSSIELEL